jgi:cell division protein FtsB
VNDRRGRPGHAQKWTVQKRTVQKRIAQDKTAQKQTAQKQTAQKQTAQRAVPTRPLQSATSATPCEHSRAPARTHMAPASRTHRHEDVATKGAETSKAPKGAAVQTRMERRRAIRRRRARIVWVVCGAFCLLVLATSFPAEALIRQHDAISSSSSELDRLTAGNKSLQRQAQDLSNPANIDALARSDYDMVSRGEKAYQVLPTAGSSDPTNLSSGHSVLDQGPVAPGSTESQEIIGDAGSTTPSGSQSSSGPGTSGQTDGSRGAGAPHGTAGLWGRVLDTLEFWR